VAFARVRLIESNLMASALYSAAVFKSRKPTWQVRNLPRWTRRVSAKGAECKSLGQRPRRSYPSKKAALKARNKINCCSAPSALAVLYACGSWAVGPGFCIARLWRIGPMTQKSRLTINVFLVAAVTDFHVADAMAGDEHYEGSHQNQTGHCDPGRGGLSNYSERSFRDRHRSE
jgi:hypothetical protein